MGRVAHLTQLSFDLLLPPTEILSSRVQRGTLHRLLFLNLGLLLNLPSAFGGLHHLPITPPDSRPGSTVIPPPGFLLLHFSVSPSLSGKFTNSQNGTHL